jgi:hypothetical protein
MHGGMIANIIYSVFFKFGGELQLLDPQGILDHGFSTASDLNKKLAVPASVRYLNCIR